MIIINLLVYFLGGYWNLKKMCNRKIVFFSFTLRKIYRLYSSYYCSSIGYNTFFEGPAIFPHNLSGIFISGEASIGRNVIIYQHVTIGSNKLSGSKNFGAPKIGNSVLIGAGATIIGRVNIGDNVRIAANSSVFFDVPSNSIVFSDGRVKTSDEILVNKFHIKKGGRVYYYNDGYWVLEINENILAKHV